MVERLARWVGLAVALISLAASADDVTERARKLFQSGRELYQQARYREAIDEFERAYALKPHGAIQFNIAQCLEKLGELPGAIERYKRYLAEVPKAEDRATVQLVIANLERRLLESRPQPLEVRSAPPGAEVLIDGERRGITPLRVEVKPGPHQLELGLPQHVPARREVVTNSERPTEVDFILERQAAPVTFLTRPRLWTWVALGASALAAGTGVYFGLQAQRDSDALRFPEGDVPHDQQTANALFNDARKKADSANLFFAGSAVAGVAGAALFFVEGRF